MAVEAVVAVEAEGSEVGTEAKGSFDEGGSERDGGRVEARGDTGAEGEENMVFEWVEESFFVSPEVGLEIDPFLADEAAACPVDPDCMLLLAIAAQEKVLAAVAEAPGRGAVWAVAPAGAEVEDAGGAEIAAEVDTGKDGNEEEEGDSAIFRST